MSEAYYSPPTLAKRFGITVNKIHSWIERGELVAINIATQAGGRPRWKISAEALAAFEQARSSRPAPPPAPRRKSVLPAVTEYIK